MMLVFCLMLSVAKADDHRYGNWIQDRAPTCTLEGHEKRYCKDCDHWEQRYTPKLPHTVEQWTVTKEPTCTEDGARSAYCTVCGSFLRVKLDKLGHDWQVLEADKAPTCDSSGTGTLICSRCGRTKTGKIAKLTHQFTPWTVTSEPRGKTKGTREHTCTLCGKTFSEKFYYEGTLYEGMMPNEEVIRLQVMLRDLGYYTGKISSGSFGSMTGKAVYNFQKAQGLPATEVADIPTLQRMAALWMAKTGRDVMSITSADAGL